MGQPPPSGHPQLSAHIDHDRFVGRTRVAYFSMEIAISPEMPTYSGGLGILAGDTARAAADLDLPIVFVTLISRAKISRKIVAAQRYLSGWWKRQRKLPFIGDQVVCLSHNQAGCRCRLQGSPKIVVGQP
jgi:hypothetical protein